MLFASLRSFLGLRSSKLRVGSSCQWPRATGTWPRSQVHPVARGGTIAPPERRERVIFFRCFIFLRPPRVRPYMVKPRSSAGRWDASGAVRRGNQLQNIDRVGSPPAMRDSFPMREEDGGSTSGSRGSQRRDATNGACDAQVVKSPPRT